MENEFENKETENPRESVLDTRQESVDLSQNENKPIVAESTVPEFHPEEDKKEEASVTSEEEEHPVYTDPNANVTYNQPSQGNYSYGNPNTGYSANYQQRDTVGKSYQNAQSGADQVHHMNYSHTYTPQQNHTDESPLSLGEWLLTLLIGLVPCFGLIVYCIWAFGSGGNVNRKNYCRAYLIINVIAFFIVLFFFVIAAIGVGIVF